MSDMHKVLPTIQGLYVDLQKFRRQLGHALNRVEALEAEVQELKARRGPGRPRKVPVEGKVA